MAEPTPTIRRAENFASAYANNFQLEQSAFDLSMIFGQLVQNNSFVELHTSVTIPWVSAKLLIYYLQVNITAFELVNGKIKIPDDLLPKAVEPQAGLDLNEKSLEILKSIERLREEFLSSL